MSENKTKPTTASVDDFLSSIEDEQKRTDSQQLVKLMQEITGEKPVMWGSIVGFGTHHYKYASGREGDTVRVGFAPRKAALTLYGLVFYDNGRDLLPKLGKHTTGKGCLYIKKLTDVDMAVLREMIKQGYEAPNPYNA